MKFKLILIKPIYRIFRLVFTLLVRLTVIKSDNISFFGKPGDLAEICLWFYKYYLNPKMMELGVELHLSEV
jgi:hypothetical protein